MRHCPFLAKSVIGAALAVAAAMPAFADSLPQPGTAPDGPDMRPVWQGDPNVSSGPGFDPRARDAWLADCRQRIAIRDNGVGGAVIGGVAGGLLGNRIAGRGNRTVGTVAGAAVGAAAGMAIDRAGDRSRARDECEAYLDSYYDHYMRYGPAGYAQAGYGYGHYGAGYASNCCAPARGTLSRGRPECTETVEYVYEDVPVRPRARRVPAQPTKNVRDKRVKIN